MIMATSILAGGGGETAPPPAANLNGQKMWRQNEFLSK